MNLRLAKAAKLYSKIVGSLLLAMLFVALSAYAEEAGSASQQAAENFFKWINFALVAGVIVWLCLKKGPGFFGRRADVISSDIQKSTEMKKQAELQLQDAETKLRNLEKEVADLRASAQRESAAEADRIRDLTLTDEQKIAEAGKAEVEAAERFARLELKTLAANLAVSGAESLLVKQLTPAAQEALINNFVKTLDGRPN
ncbi:MAG: F-type H+-transporting ATPase subunit b [Acidobacteriaceae bacterium]|jgi:F-type H+-transporting ATPase subunit b|nr:F-type H+-transporting ATPase subunit b [Acidobacteriaceae bacterium]